MKFEKDSRSVSYHHGFNFVSLHFLSTELHLSYYIYMLISYIGLLRDSNLSHALYTALQTATLSLYYRDFYCKK